MLSPTCFVRIVDKKLKGVLLLNSYVIPNWGKIMTKPIRILQILHSMNRGGAENALMNYYRHIDRNSIQFDFLLTDQLKCQFEDEILSLGGHVFRVHPLTISNPFPYRKYVFSISD